MWILLYCEEKADQTQHACRLTLKQLLEDNFETDPGADHITAPEHTYLWFGPDPGSV